MKYTYVLGDGTHLEYLGIMRLEDMRQLRPMLRIVFVNGPSGAIDLWQCETYGGLDTIRRFYKDAYDMDITLRATPTHCLHVMT